MPHQELLIPEVYYSDHKPLQLSIQQSTPVAGPEGGRHTPPPPFRVPKQKIDHIWSRMRHLSSYISQIFRGRMPGPL